MSNAKFQIPSSEFEPLSEDDFWKNQIETGRKVEPLKKPCGDCAITTGFYLDDANRLAKQPKEVQEAVVDRWFCHNACNRGCRGIREFLEKRI